MQAAYGQAEHIIVAFEEKLGGEFDHLSFQNELTEYSLSFNDAVSEKIIQQRQQL